VPAAVSSQRETKYSTTDINPLPGHSLYRLVSVDQDGKETIHPIKRIVVPAVWNQNVLIPNPVDDGVLNIYMNLEKKQKITIRLVDVAGRLLQQQDRQPSAGQTQYQFDVSALQKGFYLVQIIGEDFKTAKKISIE
jgi:hypothetical protein